MQRTRPTRRVTPRKEAETNHIVIGTDGSPGATAAVEEGLELARRLGARVTFVSVFDSIPPFGDAYYANELLERRKRAHEAAVDALAEAEHVGVAADVEIREGSVAEEILRTGRYCDAEMIVVGPRGLGAIAGVLVVKEPAKAAEPARECELAGTAA
jgi:nucleotide-binding universal stress UspA family protein